MLSETVKSWPTQWMEKGREWALNTKNTILNARFTHVPNEGADSAGRQKGSGDTQRPFGQSLC